MRGNGAVRSEIEAVGFAIQTRQIMVAEEEKRANASDSRRPLRTAYRSRVEVKRGAIAAETQPVPRGSGSSEIVARAPF
ncbi:unnamed protein product, partial [Iphiclides podalirius]